MLKDFIILTLKGIRYRPIRSWLTVLGIVIGIMLVVIILALGSGIQNAVSKTLQSFGSDLIMIFPGKETNPLVGFLGGQKFKEKDLMDLEKIDGVKFVVPMEVAILNSEYRGEKKSILIHAAPWSGMKETYEESQGIKLEKGKWPQDDQAKEVVLGYKTVNDLFKNKMRLGDEIIIKSKRMKVVGVVSEVGEQMSDNTLYISLAIFRDMVGLRGVAGSALVKAMPDSNINLVAKQIRFQLSKQEVVRDFSVLTPEKSERLIGNVLSIIELVLVTIALISLVVGAVGVMNTMYTSVLERTKQIGIMKAIGASNDAILSLFLIESGMIGLVGGVLGVILGILSAYFIGVIAAGFGVNGLFSFASLDFFGIFVVLLITFIIGVVSGVLPAKQASHMEPAEALRYE
ncbi:MAG: ABC transporter permease [Patescibacteria group bacterium]|nr:MAG: ABC transporter permease [Patescibacteria group bacterium]